jgi:hypothetical protein
MLMLLHILYVFCVTCIKWIYNMGLPVRSHAPCPTPLDGFQHNLVYIQTKDCRPYFIFAHTGLLYMKPKLNPAKFIKTTDHHTENWYRWLVIRAFASHIFAYPRFYFSIMRSVSILSAATVEAVVSHHPDDGGSKHLWNVGKLQTDYTAQHPRRQPSSYSSPWEPEISLWGCVCKLSDNRILW